MSLENVKAELEFAAERFESLCGHVSVRDEEDIPIILAISHSLVRSIDLHPSGTGYAVEYWKGQEESEEFVGVENFPDLLLAVEAYGTWLVS